MSYADAIRFLYDLRWFGAKLGLDNTFRLAELAGNPQNRLRFIHVAGTNGKGSTCAILESIYRASGLRVGLFTSPHLVSFRERIQVNRQLIAEADVVRLLEELKPALATFAADHHPTFFEVVTVMALRYFVEQQCDLVIWETGLGGRLDATNIVTPLASVITNVQYDHEKWLGNTLTEIATEKAGIIKTGVPVLTAAKEPEVLRVIETTAQARNAALIKVDETAAPSRNSSNRQSTLLAGTQATAPGNMPDLPLLGDHQRLNAALAVATVEALQDRLPVSKTELRTGLAKVHWAGRMQLIQRPGGQNILLDCAHNLAGATTLADALHKYFASVKPVMVLGILLDKDWQHICGVLAPLALRIITVPVSSERSAAPQELASACQSACPGTPTAACSSLAEALAKVEKEAFVTISGSLYLVGEAIELLGLNTEAGASERALNEWGGACHQVAAVPTAR